MYAHVKRRERIEYEKMDGLVRLLCSFISPEMAKKLFEDTKTIDSDNFFDDLASMDPHFDPSKYEDALAD